MQGDCRVLLLGVPAESVDCILTDPPYGETRLAWDRWPEGWLAAAHRVLKPTGSMWCFGSTRLFMAKAAEFERSGWRMSHDVVWEKNDGAGFAADRFRKVHEMVLHFYKVGSPWPGVWEFPQYTYGGKAIVRHRPAQASHWTGAIGADVYQSDGRRLMRSVLLARNMNGRAVHPTQKPQELLTPLLEYACPPGGLVLDPFAGSGSTGLTAAASGRNAWLIEADAAYVATINRRLAEGGLL
jgi:site-specific DNA-methyltransferase (adenine-specific)